MRNNSVRPSLLVLFCLLNSTSVGPESTAIPQPTATSSAISSSSTSSSHKTSIIGPVVGGVVAGVVALGLISIAIILLLRRRPITSMNPVVTTWDPSGSLQEGKAGMAYPPYPIPVRPPEHSPLLYVSHLVAAF